MENCKHEYDSDGGACVHCGKRVVDLDIEQNETTDKQMNRELKFRVWDKMRKMFLLPKTGHSGHYTISLDGKFYNTQNGSGGDEYEIQQFIGIIDTNGKEVYEGDIVNFVIPAIPHGRERDEYKNQEVSYDKEYAHFTFGMLGFCMLDDITELEVVGNIYENKQMHN